MAVNWNGVGISFAGSGAGLIHHAWLGEIAIGSSKARGDCVGTAIDLSSGEHDAMVSDVIIFSGKVNFWP